MPGSSVPFRRCTSTEQPRCLDCQVAVGRGSSDARCAERGALDSVDCVCTFGGYTRSAHPPQCLCSHV
eukprot:scaffold2724_cov260-Pinguiococcus_pyrenoidosus.AAC.6